MLRFFGQFPLALHPLIKIVNRFYGCQCIMPTY